jgi:hypothetical protein
MSSNLNLQVESLQHLNDLSKRAAAASDKVAVIKLPDEPPGVYGLVRHDGSFERIVAAAKPRDHRLLSVDQVPLIVKQFAEDATSKPSIWVSVERVVILQDDQPLSRRESKATCELRKTPEFQCLMNAAKQEVWKSQKDFIRLLRVTLADALVGETESLVTLLRSIKFGSKTDGHGRVQQGRESYGRSIEAEVYAEGGNLPEEMYLQLRVFDDPALKTRYPLTVGLEIDTTSQAFALVVSEQSIVNLIDQALADILALFGNLDEPSYLGSP